MALDNIIIGQRIQQYRSEKGLSQEELGALVYVSREHISRIEIGAKTPSLEMVVLIANILGVTANDLLGDNLTHSSSELDKEVHKVFSNCSPDKTRILLKTMQFLKNVLSEYKID